MSRESVTYSKKTLLYIPRILTEGILNGWVMVFKNILVNAIKAVKDAIPAELIWTKYK